ncbi:hypothetical protein CIK83_16095 [Vibrio casei]|uniref:O-antigen ligase domain-containing protein n=2 Tax=Vibrio casei TaxID=673372 RepID=A0A368LG24_9VIBR|nr:hypothetical protein CIK83_16095 [Vibrio casei]
MKMLKLNKSFIYKIECFYLILVSFLFLYGISMPVVVNSSYVAFFFIFILMLRRNVFECSIYILKSKIVLLLILCISLLIYFSIFTSVINGTYDFSILPTHVNNLATIFFSIVCTSYFIVMKDKYDISLYKLLSIIFLLQCFFVILMLLSPSFSMLVQSVTKTEAQISRLSSYNGIRGLGLTGFVAFGFSITMGILYPIMSYWIKYESKLNDFFKILILLIGAICSLSAGRTSILGIFIGLFIVIYPIRIEINYILRSMKVYFIIIAILIALIYIIFNNKELTNIAIFYSRYVFQSIWNYIEYGSFSVQSLEHLDSMYFYPDDLNWLIGSGHYTNADGSYYMHTDAGYMRFILYFGLIGSLIAYVCFILFSLTTIGSLNDKVIQLILILIFLSSFIYHYKGEVIMFSVPYNRVYFLIFFWSYFNNRLSI